VIADLEVWHVHLLWVEYPAFCREMPSAYAISKLSVLTPRPTGSQCAAYRPEYRVYGLIAAGISIAIIAVVQSLGSSLNTTFTSVQTALK
jgi:hypothetical protein